MYTSSNDRPVCCPAIAVLLSTIARRAGICLWCAAALLWSACASDPPPHPRIYAEDCDTGDEVVAPAGDPWAQGEAPPPQVAAPETAVPEAPAPEEAPPSEEELRNQRNLERAKVKLHEAYERFKDALGPAADYVSAKTRQAYEKGKKALNDAIEAIQEDQHAGAGEATP